MIRFHNLRPLTVALTGLAFVTAAASLPAKGKGPTTQRMEGSIYVPLPPPPYTSPLYPGTFNADFRGPKRDE